MEQVPPNRTSPVPDRGHTCTQEARTVPREPSPAARTAGILLTWVLVACLAALAIAGTWAAIRALL